MKSLAGNLAPALSQETPDTRALKNKGYVLNEVHVGLGISTGGDIGIAQATAQAFGKLIFTKDENSAPVKDAEFELPEQRSVNLIAPDSNLLEPAVYEGADAKRSVRGRGTVVKVSQARFNKGMAHALHMASYFTNRAREVSSSKWKIIEFEAGFATSLAGDFRLATVGGTVQIEVDFHAKE